jgi:hypothetical protein
MMLTFSDVSLGLFSRNEEVDSASAFLPAIITPLMGFHGFSNFVKDSTVVHTNPDAGTNNLFHDCKLSAALSPCRV